MIAEEFLALQEIPAIFAFRPDVELFRLKLNSLLLNYSRYGSKKALEPRVESPGPIRFSLLHTQVLFLLYTGAVFWLDSGGVVFESSPLKTVHLSLIIVRCLGEGNCCPLSLRSCMMRGHPSFSLNKV